MDLLKLYWVPIRTGLYILLAIVVFSAGWKVSDWRSGKKIAAMEKANVESVMAFQAAARAKESEWRKQSQEAQNAHAQREQSLRTDAANAHTAADRLRHQLAKIGGELPGSDTATVRQRTDTFGELLGACAAEYQSVAESCDRHVNDKRTLMEAWPK